MAQVLYVDGSVATRRNDGGQYTVNVSNYADLYNSFSRILSVLEYGDQQY
jgi:prepilin-type processing-associated H-X9-DG protein